MTMPSDVTPDVAEAVRRMPDAARAARRPDSIDRPAARLKPAYLGWGIMTLVAFIGVAHLGPALHRLTRRETAIDRTRRLAIEAKHKAKKQAKRARRQADAQLRQARDLGERTFRR